MAKKFTEEEYRKIVEIADKYFVQKKLVVAPVIIKYIYDDLFSDKTVENEKVRGLSQELSLIAFPKSRDWAHDQFVEKEKKYYWKSKKTDKNGLFKTIIEHTVGYPTDSYYINANPAAFTESEIREWGYNPDMFDREEVE
ncbi:hypothetical protein R55227_BLOPHJLP_00253 [Fructobacillus tropaeoli]|uniref:hypothetical protein n=1 Tax=Fructobacillus tropaeoli TaxID=709323 RepID=UPI002D9C3AFD|nr:hypothetical protein R55227_BLOPHJLP_00253 [Fructobacillus tropaeoli]